MARQGQEAVAVPSLGGVGRERFLRDIYPQVWPRGGLGSGLGRLHAASSFAAAAGSLVGSRGLRAGGEANSFQIAEKLWHVIGDFI